MKEKCDNSKANATQSFVMHRETRKFLDEWSLSWSEKRYRGRLNLPLVAHFPMSALVIQTLLYIQHVEMQHVS